MKPRLLGLHIAFVVSLVLISGCSLITPSATATSTPEYIREPFSKPNPVEVMEENGYVMEWNGEKGWWEHSSEYWQIMFQGDGKFGWLMDVSTEESLESWFDIQFLWLFANGLFGLDEGDYSGDISPWVIGVIVDAEKQGSSESCRIDICCNAEKKDDGQRTRVEMLCWWR